MVLNFDVFVSATCKQTRSGNNVFPLFEGNDSKSHFCLYLEKERIMNTSDEKVRKDMFWI